MPSAAEIIRTPHDIEDGLVQPSVKITKTSGPLPATGTLPPQGPVTSYYTDTISQAGTTLPSITNPIVLEKPKYAHLGINIIETRYETRSQEFNELIKRDNVSFEKMMSIAHDIIMLVMRRAAKDDHDYIFDMQIQVKAQALRVKGTYNTWAGLTITIISASVSVFGGIAGLTPLFPAAFISPEMAKTLAGSAYSIGTASTGLSGVGSIFSSRSEGERVVLQGEQKAIEDKKGEREGAKQRHNEAIKTAKTAKQEFDRLQNETAKAINGS